MQIPSEYGWALIAIGGACATTIFGSIKVRLPSDPPPPVSTEKGNRRRSDDVTSPSRVPETVAMAAAAAAASTKRRHPALSIRPSPLTRDRSLSHPHREQVSLARKKFGVEYPTLYAESSHKNAKAFNCVQRAHQQTLEWMAPVMCLTASTGLVFPLAAAVSCGVWTVGKLLYIQGYSSGDPNGRHLGGAIAHLGDLPLIVMAFVAGNKVLNA